MKFRWKNVYIYYILLAVIVLAYVFSRDSRPIPIWGTIFLFVFLVFWAGNMSWEAFRRQGKAAILVSLPPEAGGHSVVHPYDVLEAMPRAGTQKGPRFTVFATGGFIHGDIAPQGKENFVVCSPEYVENTVPALICYAKLRRVEFEFLPDYVQEELLKLRYFDRVLAKAERNIWIGMTSKLDGSSTAEPLALESKFLDQNYVINQLKNLLKDKEILQPSNEGRRKSEQIVINIPEK